LIAPLKHIDDVDLDKMLGVMFFENRVPSTTYEGDVPAYACDYNGFAFQDATYHLAGRKILIVSCRIPLLSIDYETLQRKHYEEEVENLTKELMNAPDTFRVCACEELSPEDGYKDYLKKFIKQRNEALAGLGGTEWTSSGSTIEFVRPFEELGVIIFNRTQELSPKDWFARCFNRSEQFIKRFDRLEEAAGYAEKWVFDKQYERLMEKHKEKEGIFNARQKRKQNSSKYMDKS